MTNVVGSALTRDADAVCYLQAGPEVAVASTKAFVTQVVVLELIALRLAQLRGRMNEHRVSVIGRGMRELPRLAARALAVAPQVKKLAQRWSRVRNVMYVGRALGFPIAMEGALKLKELSYVHAEGYAAGELKHGPIALLDRDTPLVAVATRGATYEKVVSNVAEVRAREAPVVAVATEGTRRSRATPATSCTCRRCWRSSRRSSPSCRSSCSPTRWRWRAAPTSTSRATWPSR